MRFDVKCKKIECHANHYGYCSVLEDYIKGKPCPFYKTKLRLATEKAALKAGDWAAYRKAQKIK